MAKLDVGTYHIFLDESISQLEKILSKYPGPNMLLVDENTHKHCFPKYESLFSEFHVYSIESGEEHKTLQTCESVWKKMKECLMNRQSLMVNLGGGVIGDLGGFCASCYMRGIDFIQIPTTLLSQVDASVGGKLGVDLDGLKNMIGAFANPQAVWIDSQFLKTLPHNQLVSGYAEIIKHGLIADSAYYESLGAHEDVASIAEWSDIILRSVEIKKEVVTKDPFEKGLRKILNFGHTLGHAIETLSFNSTPLLHGNAIAAGMILESHLSVQKDMLDKSDLSKIASYILKIYGKVEIPALEHILEVLRHDKKNTKDRINFSMLSEIGKSVFNINATQEEIGNSLDYYKKL